LTPYEQAAEAQHVDENVEVHASDDYNANVGNMGHVNVDEDAYAMPPPPPVHHMQPQWEPPAGYFDSCHTRFFRRKPNASHMCARITISHI
jgi:hypothetical protein